MPSLNLNPVIVVLSPREISEVEDALSKIYNCDQLWIKYHFAVDAYNIAKKFILRRKEYTHIILVPDDLVFTKQHYDQLLADLELHPDYQVISGVCNVTVDRPNYQYAVSLKALPSKKREGREYKWLEQDTAPKFGIHKVKFAGFPAMAIRRDIFEKGIASFKNDHVFNPHLTERYAYDAKAGEPIGGCCWDVVFNNECEDAGIPRYVDFSINMKHLKVPEGQHQHLLVGERPAYTRLIPQFNPLIAVPSPRNIPKTKEYLDLLPADKLYVKYFTEDKAYAIIQKFFLEHEEYTHLVLIADDLIVERTHFDALVRTLRSDPDKYKILSGVCNVSMVGGNEYTLAVSKRFPPPNPRRHTSSYGYAFIDMRGHNMAKKDPTMHEPAPTGINQVSFSGFPCMFIARSVLERIKMRTDYEFNLQYRLPGSSVDTVFCWDAWHNKIAIYADFDVKMLHLRGWDDQCMQLLVGKEEPYTSLITADDNSSRVSVNSPSSSPLTLTTTTTTAATTTTATLSSR